MKDENREPPDIAGSDDLEEHELEQLEADDAIIGVAFKVSLAVLLVGGGLVAGVLLWLGRDTEAPPDEARDVAPPVAVETDVTAPRVPFVDVTDEAGIDFFHVNGATGKKLLPETMGGGSAFLDPDGDGDADLVLVNSCPWPDAPPGDDPPTSALYVNDGTGHFANATAGSGLDRTLYGMGVAAGDADCDGAPDLLLTAVGPNVFLHNTGGRFEERDVGVAGDPDAWSTAGAFFDADGDGDLDLFVGNYVRWSPEIDYAMDYRLTGVGRAYGPPANYGGTFPCLYRNRGDGTFDDVSEAAGMQVVNRATGEPIAKTLGVVPTDVDDDGDTDLVVANDTVRNFLFVNDGSGVFEETSALAGIGYDRQGRATGAMGVDVADFRGDGTVGIVIGNFANEMSSLYVSQRAGGLFLDEAISEGVGAPSRRVLSFGVLFLDVDLDGRLDLLQANGHLENEISQVQKSQSYEQPAQLFWNAGPDAARTFVEVPPEAAGDLATPAVGRGLSCADVDGDGDLDVLLTQSGARPRLLRNDQDLGHHWLRLTLVGAGCNSAAIGARVELEVDGRVQVREVFPSRSYLTQVELPLTFGLGAADEADVVRIRWPDGTRQELLDLAADRTHVLQR